MIADMATRPGVLLGLLLLTVTSVAQAFQLGKIERERGVIMLRAIQKDLKQHYYDSTFHRLDLASLFDSAEADIKTAPSNGDIFGIIARSLLRLNDSHTFFVPPERVARVEYGWDMRMIGDTAYLTSVTSGSDAEAQGLKVGDAVLGVDRYQPTRSDFDNLLYLYRLLSPRAAVTVLVRSPGTAEVRHVRVRSQVTLRRWESGDYWDQIREAESHAVRDTLVMIGKDVAVWRMKEFFDEDLVSQVMKRIRDFPVLIIDLRDNGGGAVKALLRLTSYLVDHVDTVATTHRRGETSPMIVTPVRRRYGGKLCVLVDAGSASASEVFARTMQLTGRGIVLGDTTAGRVMESRIWEHTLGLDAEIHYYVSVTDADVVMSDGGRLEVLGVVPDLTVLPSGADLAAGRDPALAMAMTQAGHPMDAAAAGKLFQSP